MHKRIVVARSYDPGGKLTLFDIIHLACTITGIGLGYRVGQAMGGPVALVCALIGFVLGMVIGRIPFALANYYFFRQLRRTDTETLMAQLRATPGASHVIVHVLLERGESPRELMNHILSVLLAPSAEDRWSAWRALNLCFPETAERLQRIDPSGDPDHYREAVMALIVLAGQ